MPAKTTRKRPSYGSGFSSSGGLGQAAAAEQNRQHRVRVNILQALGRIGIPQHKWPDFVRAYLRDLPRGSPYRQPISPPVFHPPTFDRLNQSPEEWRKEADAQWEQQRFLRVCEFWAEQGVDEKIA